MKKNYVSLSLETHLFFCRIMKEHSLFLMAGFPTKNAAYTKKADWYRMQFEELLREVVLLGDGRVGADVLRSGEIVTCYTLEAERKTSFLTGIGINSSITEAEKRMCPGHCDREWSELECRISKLNQRAICLTEGLIAFKEKVLKDMSDCQLFTFNYPLLVEHIIREAKLYCCMVKELEECGTLSEQNMWNMETFWNQIMMEHALFIRGLLDPSEEELINTANEFAKEYRELLNEAKNKDCMCMQEQNRKTIKETERYRDFKAAGTKGITECQIAGLILPLLADHVLREANHYLRLLETVGER